MYHNLAATNIVWKLLLTDLMAKYDIDNKINYEHENVNRNLAVLPNPDLVFAAFNHFSLDELKVVIIGQDPYINKEQAMGLSFSVPNGIKIPPSLDNIFKEFNEFVSSKVCIILSADVLANLFSIVL